MLVKFARVLRTHGIRDSLIEWKNIVLASEFARPEAFAVLQTVIEFFHQRRDYKSLALAAQDYVTLHTKAPSNLPLRSQAASTIAAIASDLQKVLLKNRRSEEAPAISAALAGSYMSLTQIIPESDPRVPGAHYNLAETLFALDRYDEATLEYGWVADRWKNAWRDSKLNPSEIAVKRVNSRYQAFRKKDFLTSLVGRARTKNRDGDRFCQEKEKSRGAST